MLVVQDSIELFVTIVMYSRQWVYGTLVCYTTLLEDSIKIFIIYNKRADMMRRI